MIKPTARLKLTPNDVDYIASVFEPSRSNQEAVLKLLATPSERDAILDHPKLFSHITTYPNMTRISLSLYFYLLVRHTLLEHGIDDREVADYLASMLSEFAADGRSEKISKYHEKRYGYIVDMLEDLPNANSEQFFLLQSHLGNYCMFMLGLYPDRIFHRANFGRAAPSQSWYEEIGRSGYHYASRSQIAEKWRLAQTLEILGSEFRTIRFALNDMSERRLNLDDNAQKPEKVIRRVNAFIERKRYLS